MRLAIVVPALNEEEAIAGTLRRVLDARQKVVAQTHVKEMIVVFVNDGSTDRTQEVVDQPEFNEVVKVRFEKNRGYGAAIKAGWHATDADLVGFIDGDGTCDPDFCVNLLSRMSQTNADVVLAGRLNPNSQMPLIRKIGNKIFATLLGAVSGHTEITDTASGFRIVKRDSLKFMSPLPDGLHFTPAMSCICLLDPRLRIEEVPMPYKERIGRSKLSVIKDGFRFLYTILFSACCYSPIKTMLGASAIVAALVAIATWLAAATAGPASALPVSLALAGALTIVSLLLTGVICHQLNFLLIGPRKHIGPTEQFLQSILDYQRLLYTGGTLLAFSVIGLVGIDLLDVLQGRAFHLVHAALVFLAACAATAAATGIILRVIWAVGEKQKALITDEYHVTNPQNENQPAHHREPNKPYAAPTELSATNR